MKKNLRVWMGIGASVLVGVGLTATGCEQSNPGNTDSPTEQQTIENNNGQPNQPAAQDDDSDDNDDSNDGGEGGEGGEG